MPELKRKTAYEKVVKILEEKGVSCLLHEHEATRTVEEAERNLSFDVTRLVKTVAFQTRDGALVLAALRGIRRVDYARLAGLLGINRRDLFALSPEQVRERLGVEPGSVSPLSLMPGTLVLIDNDVLAIHPTLYCGTGRPDRTLELTAHDLVRAAGARVGDFSRRKERNS
ncbi:MAG TPA: YbaK/EbsC family protein [Geobacteraceae bacterium]|nr:YbaK/EbsC family protein [Geobacteraceae bacterium]